MNGKRSTSPFCSWTGFKKQKRKKKKRYSTRIPFICFLSASLTMMMMMMMMMMTTMNDDDDATASILLHPPTIYLCNLFFWSCGWVAAIILTRMDRDEARLTVNQKKKRFNSRLSPKKKVKRKELCVFTVRTRTAVVKGNNDCVVTATKL